MGAGVLGQEPQAPDSRASVLSRALPSTSILGLVRRQCSSLAIELALVPGMQLVPQTIHSPPRFIYASATARRAMAALPSTSTPENTPVIDENPQLQSYYLSLESRVGYRLLLGGTRHFGYWDYDTYWPFPVSKFLRAMEDKLAQVLALPPGAQVLDAGCGVGHVAIRMAKTHGLRITGIDVVDHHIAKARRNIARCGLPDGAITVQKMDYHHLDSLASASLDGAYTMETFVHATDPTAVLAGFHRLLRPGGRLALFEYDHEFLHDSPEDMATSMRKINRYAAMPTNDLSHPGVFEQMLREAGFEDIVVRDYSENIRPMTRLFFLVAIIPYLLIRLLGLERFFINTVAGVESYRGHGRWRFVAITASKPGGPLELGKI